MHTLFNGLIKEKFVVLNFAEAFRLHTTTNTPPVTHQMSFAAARYIGARSSSNSP